MAKHHMKIAERGQRKMPDIGAFLSKEVIRIGNKLANDPSSSKDVRASAALSLLALISNMQGDSRARQLLSLVRRISN